jgi:PGM1 C-terminal domain
VTIDVRDQAAYDELQRKLVPLWKSLQQLNNDAQTIVVVPSAKIDFELPASVLQAYEERYLFLLLLLRQPRAQMVYVTGQSIHPDVIDYYLDLMPGVISSHARRRLHLLSPMEATFRPLTDKILERPRLIERIKSLVIDPDRAHLVPFMATWADRELAMRLGIPMYGPDPKDAALGTKSESRRIFEETGVNHPLGKRDLQTKDDIMSAIVAMRAEKPGLHAVVVKHNEGVSGFGNAIVEVGDLPPPGDSGELRALEERLDRLPVEFPGVGIDEFFAMFEKGGGVVEEMIVADEIRSPSAQLRVTPLGEVELLSTHDQMLGGDSGQVFLGSRFPADSGYASMISADALRVGRRLAELGVIGRFAIDFVVSRAGSGPWVSNAIEINLRKGGTTHPFLTLQFLTDGAYDPETGLFTSPTGKQKFYVASDHFAVPGLRTLLPNDLLDIALVRGCHFDQASQVGTVFHMLGALPVLGQIGVTCVGDSAEEAQERYDRLAAVLSEEAGAGAEG